MDAFAPATGDCGVSNFSGDPCSPKFILKSLLHGHTGIIAVINAYLDETGTHDGAAITSMAAYLFDVEQAMIFTERWDEVIAKFKPRGIHYFHAKDCIPVPRSNPFDVLTDQEAEGLVSSLVALIQQTARIGFVRFVTGEDWNGFCSHSPMAQRFIGSAYTACGFSCVQGIKEILDEQGYSGKVIYYFESGNEHQGELAHFLGRFQAHPQLREKYRCEDFGFYQKTTVAPLQGADLLAWEWQRAYKNATVPGRTEWRKTLSELTRSPFFASGFSRESIGIQAMVNAFYGIASNEGKYSSQG